MFFSPALDIGFGSHWMPGYVIWYKWHMPARRVVVGAGEVTRSMVVATMHDLVRETAHALGMDEAEVRAHLRQALRSVGHRTLTRDAIHQLSYVNV